MKSPITLIFSTSGGFLSWLIRKIQGSDISHCAIGTSMHGVPVVIEDTAGGVRIYPRARWEQGKKIVREYAFVPDMDSGLHAAIQRVGDKYDYVGLIGMLWVMLGRWLHQKWKNPIAKPGAAWCSEFVVRMDVDKVIPEWDGLDPETVAPRDLDRLCRLGVSFRQITSEQNRSTDRASPERQNP
jgi:hypothetical protein